MMTTRSSRSRRLAPLHLAALMLAAALSSASAARDPRAPGSTRTLLGSAAAAAQNAYAPRPPPPPWPPPAPPPLPRLKQLQDNAVQAVGKATKNNVVDWLRETFAVVNAMHASGDAADARDNAAAAWTTVLTSSWSTFPQLLVASLNLPGVRALACRNGNPMACAASLASPPSPRPPPPPQSPRPPSPPPAQHPTPPPLA